MKKEAVYESHISTARWLVYDVPGNVGWIMYLVCLIRCFVQRPEFLEIPLVLISLVIGILPAIAMAKEPAELYPENWKYDFHVDMEKRECIMNYHSCAICNMCKREGCFDLLKYMCKIDFVSQELMGNTLIRTKTLAEGYDVCDFHIIGKR